MQSKPSHLFLPLRDLKTTFLPRRRVVVTWGSVSILSKDFILVLFSGMIVSISLPRVTLSWFVLAPADELNNNIQLLD